MPLVLSLGNVFFFILFYFTSRYLLYLGYVTIDDTLHRPGDAVSLHPVNFIFEFCTNKNEIS